MNRIRTDILEIAFEEGGPPAGRPVLLLHGWPDAPRGWHEVSQRLQAAGYRTIAPYLRGFSPTRFLSDATPRVGAGVALAQDAIDLADALGLDRIAVLGHDWGAREAYLLAALFPERVAAIVTESLGFQPGARSRFLPSNSRDASGISGSCARTAAPRRCATMPVGFARLQWDTWSSPGWFDEVEFARTAESFSDPDWAAITLNAYRARWRAGEAWDSRYDALQRRLGAIESVPAPTLMIQGLADSCDPPSESEDQHAFFTGGYRRLLLEAVGHFPHREAPAAVAEATLDHLRQHYGRAA